MRLPPPDVVEAWVAGPLRVVHRGAEPAPVVVVPADDRHPLLDAGASIHVVRRHRWRGAPVAGGRVRASVRAPVRLPVEGRGTGERDAGLDLRDVDVLPFARQAPVMQAEQDGARAEIASHVVEVGERPARRPPARQPEHVGEPGERLRRRPECHVGRVPPTMAEARHAHVDEVGLQAAELLVGQAHPDERAGGEALGQRVGPRDEATEEVEAPRVLQIERDASLSARVVLEEDTATVETLVGRGDGHEPRLLRQRVAGQWHEGRHQPHRIRARPRFHPDHLGPHGAAERGRLRAVAEAGEVDDTGSGQRALADGGHARLRAPQPALPAGRPLPPASRDVDRSPPRASGADPPPGRIRRRR